MFQLISCFFIVIISCDAIIVSHSDPNYRVKNDYAVPIRNSYYEDNSGSSKFVYYTYPKYHYEYDVSDVKTGDHKRHKESRDGDVVKGEYSLVEPDGNLRRVQYEASDKHGFNAHVSAAIHKHGNNAFSKVEQRMHHFTDKKKYYKNSDSIPLFFKSEEKPVFKAPEVKEPLNVDNIKSFKKQETTTLTESKVEEKKSETSDAVDIYVALNQMKEVFGAKMVKNVMTYLMDMTTNMKEKTMNQLMAADEGTKTTEKQMKSARSLPFMYKHRDLYQNIYHR